MCNLSHLFDRSPSCFVLLTLPAPRTGAVIAQLDLKKPPRDNPPSDERAREPREELAEGRVTVGKFFATSSPLCDGGVARWVERLGSQ